MWDAAELGEHGLAVQAFELDHDGQVTSAGPLAWVWERAPVEDAVAVVGHYLAGLPMMESP